VGIVTSFPNGFLSFGFIWDATISLDGRLLVPSVSLEPPNPRLLRVYTTSRLHSSTRFPFRRRPPRIVPGSG